MSLPHNVAASDGGARNRRLAGAMNGWNATGAPGGITSAQAWRKFAEFKVLSSKGIVSMRIVLAEASRADREPLTRLLEARGHVVKAFADGPEALHHIATNLNIDALMASADLPSMSGMELCWETRLLSSSRRPIYIILMASERDRGKLIEALDSGADDFISTPPRAEELYARLRAAERLAKFQHELIRLAISDPLTNISEPPRILRAGQGGLRAGGRWPCRSRNHAGHRSFQEGQRRLRTRSGR